MRFSFGTRISSRQLLTAITSILDMPPQGNIHPARSNWDITLEHLDGSSLELGARGGAPWAAFSGTNDASNAAIDLLDFIGKNFP